MTIEMERVDENRRVVLSDSANIYIDRVEGVDLWEIKFEKGPLNKELEGRFTTPVNAFEKIKNYLETNPHRQRVANKAKGE
jgi:hypothetical protein